MQIRSWLRGLPLAAVVACNESGTPSDGEPMGETPSGGDVRCSYYYRPSNEVMEGQTGNEPIFQLEERLFTVGPDEDASELLGQITLAVNYDMAEFDSDSITLSATAGEARIISILYQLSEAMPRNQFAGGHGFTGLLYFTHPTAGGDYQAFCESLF